MDSLARHLPRSHASSRSAAGALASALLLASCTAGGGPEGHELSNGFGGKADQAAMTIHLTEDAPKATLSVVCEEDRGCDLLVSLSSLEGVPQDAEDFEVAELTMDRRFGADETVAIQVNEDLFGTGTDLREGHRETFLDLPTGRNKVVLALGEDAEDISITVAGYWHVTTDHLGSTIGTACTDEESPCGEGGICQDDGVCTAECFDDEQCPQACGDSGLCETEPLDCAEDEFQCAAGPCIPADNQCDGKIQCPAGSDELDCSESCGEAALSCDDLCIPEEEVCDGFLHCGDGSDEVGCSLNCSPLEMACFNEFTCVSRDVICDGVHDCEMGLDEVNCPTDE